MAGKGGGISFQGNVELDNIQASLFSLFAHLEGCDKVVGVHKDVDDARGRIGSSRCVSRGMAERLKSVRVRRVRDPYQLSKAGRYKSAEKP